MKVRLATVLSLTGVLVAGSAAAMVNTQVLNGSANNAAENVTLADSSLPDAVDPSTTFASVTTLDGTTFDATTLPPDTPGVPVTAAPAGTQAVYQIGEAGTVTLDTAGEMLTIVAAVPNGGWTVVEAKSEDALNIEVKFRSPITEVEFHATLLFGVVGTSVESKSLVPTTTGGTTGGTTATTPSSGTTHYSDDDDDDEEEHEEDDD